MEILYFLIGVGAVQGILLALVLLSIKSSHRNANRFLALLFLAMSLALGMSLYYEKELFYAFPHLITLESVIGLAETPLLFFYVLALAQRDFKFTSRQLLHFLPALIFALLSLPFHLMSAEGKLSLLLESEGLYAFLLIIPDIIGIYVQFFIYYFKILKMLRLHEATLKESYSRIDRINLSWLKTLVTIYAGFYAFEFLSSLFLWMTQSDWSYNYIKFALFFYLIFFMQFSTFRMLRRPEILFRLEALVDKAKYEKSPLTEGQIEQYAARLVGIMKEEKPYLDNELSLQELADSLGISYHSLSQIINVYYGKSFYDFVNTYRVEEAKALLRDRQDSTILEIAFDAGFNSKSSFNAVFKKNTGLTPTEYRASH